MTLTMKIGGIWSVLSYGDQIVNLQGIAAPYMVVLGWTKADQEVFGVFVPDEPATPPAGKIEISRTLQGISRPIWQVLYKDISLPTKADLLDISTSTFKVHRDGGFLMQGMTISTNEESRGLIDGAYSLSQLQPNHIFDYRTNGQWIQLDGTHIKSIASSVGLWVQACYTARRDAEAGIASGSLTTEASIHEIYAAISLPE